MQYTKCEMPGCQNYIEDDEVKIVEFEGKPISICPECDDGSLKPVRMGGKHGETSAKIEKIERHKRTRLW